MSAHIVAQLERVISGEADHILFGADCGHPPKVVFPGSFHPLHKGHREIARLAAELIGHPVYYEIAIHNVDKPSLSVEQMIKRLDQFDKMETVAVTGAMQFFQKAVCFPQTVFAVGIDTLIRIGSVAYYATDDCTDSEEAVLRRDRAIDRIAAEGCRFLVFGRKVDQNFCTLEQLALPAPLSSLCQSVPESCFRQDISSSDLRE